MKKLTLTLAALLACTPIALAQKEHQKVEGEAAYTSSGSKAIEGDLLETRTEGDATLARLKPDMGQWGFVNYWIGIPAPEGSSIIRFRVFNTAEETAKYLVYIQQGDNQKMLGALEIPADAPANEFVDVDIEVDSDTEYSGIVLKKSVKESAPSPWIDTVSVLLAE